MLCGANSNQNRNPLTQNVDASREAVTEAEGKRYAELQLIALDAARSGDSSILAPIIWAGLSVDLQDHQGNTLLMLACYHGHAEMAEGTIRSAGAVRGLLRVNVNPTFARLVLAPRIGLFLEKYTELLST